ncbi:MAG: lasso peptide biosynthesis B2 protein [Woeseiaceae bacterium]
MTTLPYQLAQNVFFCFSGSHLVFLDLPRNKYFCLNAHNTRLATHLFPGLADRNDNSSGPDSIDIRKEAQRVAAALVERGLLTQGDTKCGEAQPLRIQTVRRVAVCERMGREPAVRIGHLTTFFHASLKASWKLRWYSMLRTVRSIVAQKDRRIEPHSVNQQVLSDLVRIFHRLRPFYGRKYLCLYDSLALLQFLAAYRLFPQWVFGVKAEPFGAHCWVQEGDCVLNDAVEFVREYTPIMAT